MTVVSETVATDPFTEFEADYSSAAPADAQPTRLCSHKTFEAVSDRWQTYQIGVTEQRLGLVATRLQSVRRGGRHSVWAMDETDQPTSNFKDNGIRNAVDQNLARNSDVETFYIGSAGNAGAALVKAVTERGKKVVVETPEDLVAPKRVLLEHRHSTVNSVHPTVEAATTAARQKAEADDNGVFLHAYNDLDAIAGQGFVARRALSGLLRLQSEGGLDLQTDRVRLLIQRGGGSLLTGFACALHLYKQKGLVGDNVELWQVRPDESVARYDGLNVSEPGSYAQSMIDDPEFVSGTLYVDDAATGQAALDAYRRFGKKYEPSGLAGLAAVNACWSSEEPTTFLTVLSGANTTDKAWDYFADAPRKAQTNLLADLGGRSLNDLLDVPYGPPNSNQIGPIRYGRYPI